MELSKRLQAVAQLLDSCLCAADIGTDHGYIPIYLIESDKCRKVIAMDINDGPLLRAKEHILECGLSEQIDVRKSDGAKALHPGECDAVIAAGMGGALIVKILEDSREVFASLKQFVLQPQSELSKVRKYLCDNGYCVTKEDMVLEDGKFYPMMKVINGRTSQYNTVELRYGKYLLEEKHPVLKIFLEKEIEIKKEILKNLAKETGEHIEARKKELQKEIEEAEEALRVYM